MITTKHIHSFSVDKTTRDFVGLNDPAYIRIYDESRRLGVRLAGPFNVPAQRQEFSEACKLGFTVPPDIAPPPPFRYYTSIAFDSSRGVHVLFGGYNHNPFNIFADTWEFNGSSWTQVFPTVSPPAKYAHCLVYDKARNRTVLFGGYGTASPNQIWEYDGTTWVLALTAPLPFHSPSAAYDEDRQLIVIYTWPGNTYEYNGTLTGIITTETPNVDSGGGDMVYDIHRKRIVMLSSTIFDYSDYSPIQFPLLWEFFDGQWHRTNTSPIETSWPGMFYDRKNRATVLFNGFRGWAPAYGGTYVNKAWAFDGTSVHELPRLSPMNDLLYDCISYDENELVGVSFGACDYNGNPPSSGPGTQKVALSDPLAIARFPEWKPQAVKAWGAFSERARKPAGTSVLWRLGDGTVDRWFDGTAWVPAVAEDEWNSETEVSAALSLFPVSARTIAPIAKLITLDRFSTPVLLGYDIMIEAVFDWFEDLILRGAVPRLRNDFQFITDFSAVMAAAGGTFNFKTDRAFIPEQDLNIIGVDSVFNHTLDPNHMTDILSTYDLGTGAVTLTAPVLAGTRLFIRYIVTPEVVVNFTNSDYYEIGKTPTIVIENIAVEAQQAQAVSELVNRGAGPRESPGWKTSAPLWVKELTLNCVLMAGGLVDLFRFYTAAAKVALRGTHISTDEQGATLHTPGLDRKFTLKFLPASRYNPKPNLADLKTVSFGFSVCNFYAWLRDLEEMQTVRSVNCSIRDKETAGPERGATLPEQPEPGEFGFMNTLPEVEDETTTEPGT